MAIERWCASMYLEELTNKEISRRLRNYPRGRFTKYLLVDTITGAVITSALVPGRMIGEAQKHKHMAVVRILPK